MFYDFALTITAGTTEANPAEQEMKLTHGVIQTVRLFFPPGPRGEVNVAIYHQEHQLYPTNPGGAFNADNVYISFDDYFELFSPPYVLLARGWAPTASYNHTVRIEIGVIESKIALIGLRVAKALDKFFNILGVKV
jgi:hypothetical protein